MSFVESQPGGLAFCYYKIKIVPNYLRQCWHILLLMIEQHLEILFFVVEFALYKGDKSSAI